MPCLAKVHVLASAIWQLLDGSLAGLKVQTGRQSFACHGIDGLVRCSNLYIYVRVKEQLQHCHSPELCIDPRSS